MEQANKSTPMPDDATLVQLHLTNISLIDMLREKGGSDALFAFPEMRLSAKRSLACTCSECRIMVFAHLRAEVLSVTWLDATWANALFVARVLVPFVPEQILRMQGEQSVPEMKLAHLRTLPRLKVGTMGWPAAIFFGAAIADSDATLRFSDGLTLRNLQPLRESVTANVSLPADASESDLCAMLGVLSWNPRHLRDPLFYRHVTNPKQDIKDVVLVFRDAFGKAWQRAQVAHAHARVAQDALRALSAQHDAEEVVEEKVHALDEAAQAEHEAYAQVQETLMEVQVTQKAHAEAQAALSQAQAVHSQAQAAHSQAQAAHSQAQAAHSQAQAAHSQAQTYLAAQTEQTRPVAKVVNSRLTIVAGQCK